MKKSLPVCIMVLAIFSLIYSGCAQSEPTAGNTNPESPGGTTTPTTPITPGTEIIIEDFKFKPNPLTITVGTTVTWSNKDALYHIIKSRDDLFESAPFYVNETFTHTFEEKGVFTYYCKIHGYSDAKVIVE